MAGTSRVIGDLTGSREFEERFNGLVERLHDPVLVTLQMRRKLRSQVMSGDLSAAVQSRDALIQRCEELGAPAFGRQFVGNHLRPAYIYLGMAEAALSKEGELNQFYDVADPAAVFAPRQAQLLAHIGRFPEAERLIEKILLEHSGEEDFLPPDSLNCLLDSAIQCKATTLLHRLIPYVEWAASTSDVNGVVARFLGEASSVLGLATDTRRYYELALPIAQNLGHRPELALIQLDLAELLLEHYPDERDAAIEHLDFAIAELRDMKMQPALERALRHRGLLKA
jgi:tetratricopeptide (TPR) repeat protein